jgi:putative ABC transport system permease protein
MIPKLAWRNIWRNKRRTIITSISIGLGLALAIFAISLAEGGYAQMIRDGVRMQAGHITIEHREFRDAPAIDLYAKNPIELKNSIEHLTNIESTKLIIQGQGVANTSKGGVGVVIIGVEPSIEVKSNSPIAIRMKEGEYLSDDDSELVVIGSGLAEKLKLKLGKKLVLQVSDIEGEIVQERFFVKGIYETGSDEMDGFLVQMTVDDARKLFVMPDDSVTQLGVILKNQDRLKATYAEIIEIVTDKDLAVHTWRETMPELLAFMTLDKGANIVFQIILVSLILFTIFNTILMSVIERRSEFAILLAIGTPPRQLQLQVLAESAFLGVIGVGFGLILGGLVSYHFQVNGLDLSQFLEEGINISGLAMDTKIHAKITASILFNSGILVYFATLLLSFIPMRRAANTPFVDIMR